MAVQTFSITDLYTKLEHSKTEQERAQIISNAFEFMEKKHTQENAEIKNNLATKQDLESLERKIEMTFKAEIEKTKSSTITWLCGFIVAWTGILSGILFHFGK